MGNPEEQDVIQVRHNNKMVLVAFGDKGIEMTKGEAEQLLFDLAHVLQDMHNIENEYKKGIS